MSGTAEMEMMERQERGNRRIEIALAGHPNVGKSTVFNTLCGLHQKVGNYPGVTVDKKIGRLHFEGLALDILDLPGVYSLLPNSEDERITVDVLKGKVTGTAKPELVLYVADATNLERALPLYYQIAELGIPMVFVLTMADQMAKEGITLDLDVLEQRLGVPVLAMDGRKRSDIEKLERLVKETLAGDSKFQGSVLPSSEVLPALDRARRDYDRARTLVAEVETRPSQQTRSWSDRLDALFLHRGLGLLVFVGTMFLIFQSLYSWSGPFTDLIDIGFSALGESLGGMLAETPILQSLVADGIINGVGSVVIFLPQILLLFIFIAILEDSGYMARAAFLMDKLLAWTGLNGRAFIPMLSGFACAVPAIMSTRVMSDPKSRLATILVLPLTSCSARLPVYVVLIGAFIEPRYGAAWAAFTLFAMHALGLLIALPLAWLFNRSMLKNIAPPFIMEMPPYRLPKLGNVLARARQAGWAFLTQAGTIIFACTILIWALSYFPRPDSVESQIDARYASQIESAQDEVELEAIQTQRDNALNAAYLEQSFLGRTGKLVEPVFEPLGFDWKISVGILSAFPAREVIIATLGIIYSVGEDEASEGRLIETLQSTTKDDGSPAYTALTAISLMIFFALCSQCMSTLATIKRELRSWKWTGFVFVYMTGLAYIASLLVFQVGSFMGWGV